MESIESSIGLSTLKWQTDICISVSMKLWPWIMHPKPDNLVWFLSVIFYSLFEYGEVGVQLVIKLKKKHFFLHIYSSQQQMKITSDVLKWMQMFDNWKRENAVNACSEKNWYVHDDILVRLCKVVLIKRPI